MKRVQSSSSISTSATTVKSNQSGGNKSETMTYLQCYEAMVRHQDLEFDATSAHLKGIVSRIKYLGRKGKSSSGNGNASVSASCNGSVGGNKGEGGRVAAAEKDDYDDVPDGMVTYLEMRRCLLRLGYTWNRSIHHYNCRVNDGNASQKKYYYDDDVSIASVNSTFSGGTAGTGSSSIGFSSARDIIATDAQLIMLLTTLVEMEERHRAITLATSEEKIDNDEDEDCQGLTLPEFIQAYKLIIGGMQSLQYTPNLEPSSGNRKPPREDFRTRSRERILGLLRLFGPDDTLYKRHIVASSLKPAQDNPLYSPGRIPKTIISPRRGASPSSRKSRSNSITTPTKIPRDGLKPRQFNEDSIRKLVHSKDAALARIMEEHELEMNAIKTNIEELRSKEQRSRVVLRQRRNRTRVAVAAVCAIAIAVGLAMEYQRRQEVEREIAMGRDAEREKTAERIASLNHKKEILLQKVADAEGMARFEGRRCTTLENEIEEWQSEMEDTEVKWWIDQSDLERCKIATKEMGADLAGIQSKNKQMGEEVEWAQAALQRALKQMEVLNQTLTNNADFDLNGPIGRGDTDNDEPVTKNPVKLEMKYNPSFRKGVILRQAYSAVAGVATTFVFRGLVPIVMKWFAPARVVAPVVAPNAAQLVNSVWMDRIEAVTVAGLIGRSLALFFLP